MFFPLIRFPSSSPPPLVPVLSHLSASHYVCTRRDWFPFSCVDLSLRQIDANRQSTQVNYVRESILRGKNVRGIVAIKIAFSHTTSPLPFTCPCSSGSPDSAGRPASQPASERTSSRRRSPCGHKFSSGVGFRPQWTLLVLHYTLQMVDGVYATHVRSRIQPTLTPTRTTDNKWVNLAAARSDGRTLMHQRLLNQLASQAASRRLAMNLSRFRAVRAENPRKTLPAKLFGRLCSCVRRANIISSRDLERVPEKASRVGTESEATAESVLSGSQ